MDVLISEDSSASRLLLKSIISKWGHNVIVTRDGCEAWEVLKRDDAPQVAVIDWEMPGMDGLELCRKVRRLRFKHVYIILLTANEERASIVSGFEAGVDDYIIKPFHPTELRVRLGAGIRIMRYEVMLEEKNEELRRYTSEMEKLVEAKSKQLIHVERMATVGLLSAGIAHEINNPTSFISVNAQAQVRFWEELEPVIKKELFSSSVENPDKLKFVLKEMPKTIEGVLNGVKRISSIVKGLKKFCYQGPNNGKVVCNVNDCVNSAVMFSSNALKKRVSIEKKLDEKLPDITADVQQLEQVLINLLMNAADAVDSEKIGKIIIETKYLGNNIHIMVEDSGTGISPDKVDDIWQPFFTTKEVGRGTGLGLPIILGIVKDHGGEIKLGKSRLGGAGFIITLPSNMHGQ